MLLCDKTTYVTEDGTPCAVYHMKYGAGDGLKPSECCSHEEKIMKRKTIAFFSFHAPFSLEK